MRGRKEPDSERDAPTYECVPPAWLPQLHCTGDLGYTGFYPPKPGQDEDQLSEANVKKGFQHEQIVAGETLSAQAVITDNMGNGSGALSLLERLMNEVFARRAEENAAIPASTFRMPSRVTLNETKRQSWFADLANPDVPLAKLGKSIPHGAKGHDLLELLCTSKVTVPRAIWFLRALGANETAGLRNKASYDPTKYSYDWAITITGYLKKQLSEIVLPSAPRPGLGNIKQTFKGVLLDEDSRERWVSRFTYCLKLLRTFYIEGLVDNRTFLGWLIEQLNICNLAQAGFIVRLTVEYLEDTLHCRAFSRPLADASLAKLAEIQSSAANEYLAGTEHLLKIMLQRVLIAIPEAFVSPCMWTIHSGLLERVAEEGLLTPSTDQRVEERAREVTQRLADNFIEVKRRNEALLFLHMPSKIGGLARTVKDVQLLNSISSQTDIDDLPFFLDCADDASRFAAKLDMLLSWSVTPLQFGDHRIFAAVSLIANWKEQALNRAVRRDAPSPDEFLQDQLFDWLDSSDVAASQDSIRDVASLYGELVRRGLFSYDLYVQRLIARVEQGLTVAEEHHSRHRDFLRCIPLNGMQTTPSLTSQRRVTLYGVRARQTPEDQNEREIRAVIRNVLPEVFEREPRPFLSVEELATECHLLLSASRYEQTRVARTWLYPIVQTYLSKGNASAAPDTLIQVYSTATEIYRLSKCYQCILDLTLCALEHVMTFDSLVAVINTLKRHGTIWACMNARRRVVNALYNAHQLWKARGIQVRAILELLSELDQGKYLDLDAQGLIHADMSSLTSALQPTTIQPSLVVPDVMPDILSLATNPATDPSMFANHLWISYRAAHDWGWKVWDNTFASLRQIPVLSDDDDMRQSLALRYGTFLLHIDQHLPHGLDRDILQWFHSSGQNELLVLTADAWRVLMTVIVFLTVHGALRTTTVLQGLVYPAWRRGSQVSSSAQAEQLEPWIRSANEACRDLMLKQDARRDGLPPANLTQVQALRTARQDAFRAAAFPTLAGSVPTLVLLKHNEHLYNDLRDDASEIKARLCADPDFRRAVFRDLDVVREAFEHALKTTETLSARESISADLIQSLNVMLCDSPLDADLSTMQNLTSMLSPWTIAATAIHLKFLLRRMGYALSQDPKDPAANKVLSAFTAVLFDQSVSEEKAQFIAQVVSGADALTAGKFVNSGLQCIRRSLDGIGDLQGLLSALKRSGELLRALVDVATPFRFSSCRIQLEESLQDDFIAALGNVCDGIVKILAETDEEVENESRKKAVVLLARLAQFVLGFESPPSARSKEVTSHLVSTMLILALRYGSGTCPDFVIYPLLMDTLFFLVDETHVPTKPTVPYDPYANYPDPASVTAPLDLPPEHLRDLQIFLPHLPPTATVANLATAHRDASGQLVFDTPVLNRPWEWIEHLGELSLEKDVYRQARERQQALPTLRNAGSLPLEVFAARGTGEGIPANVPVDAHTRGTLLEFQDGVVGQGLFARTWRTLRAEEGSGGSADGEEVRASPAAESVVSRSSVGTSARHSSPGQTAYRTASSTMSDLFEGDSDSNAAGSSRRTSKRKAPTSDDEPTGGKKAVKPRASKPRTTKKR
ncbi:hypothetical protein BD626DRAFT_448794 [Schizophyllum amplum]|uniref:Mediator of RNA polymerase II transcription subunit 12 n=1 Tax=Schizophyllum amplum TaxID=97359 RepID=A0A550CZT7_9AGAR|nr:hypothetical protein BD626DRAFT_448794 [Auriculariopsis ampla]